MKMQMKSILIMSSLFSGLQAMDQMDSDVFKILEKGKLTYKRHDGRLVDLPFASALVSPFKRSLDLRDCDEAGDYLSISIGPRTGYNPDNAKKVEIWICPQDMIKNNVNNDVAHYAKYLPNWEVNAPIGIFWNWGGYTDLDCWPDYLTTRNFNPGSGYNLLELWRDTVEGFSPLAMKQYNHSSPLPKDKRTIVLNNPNYYCQNFHVEFIQSAL